MNKKARNIKNRSQHGNSSKLIIESIYDFGFYKYCSHDLKQFLNPNNKNKSIFIDGKYGSGKTEYIKWFMKKEKISYFYNELKTVNFKKAIYVNNSNKKHIFLKWNNRIMNSKISNFGTFKVAGSTGVVSVLSAILYQPLADFNENHVLSIIFIVISSILLVLWLWVLITFPDHFSEFLRKLTKIHKLSRLSSEHEYSKKIIVIDDCNRYTAEEFHTMLRTYHQIFEGDDEVKLIFIGTCMETKNENSVSSRSNDKEHIKEIENDICTTPSFVRNRKYIDQTIVFSISEQAVIEILEVYIDKVTKTIKSEWVMTPDFIKIIKNIVKDKPNECVDMHDIIKIVNNYIFILQDCKTSLSNEEMMSLASYLVKRDDRSSKTNFNDISILFDNNGFFDYYKNYALNKTKNRVFQELNVNDKQIFLAWDIDNFEKYFRINQEINGEVQMSDICNAVLHLKFDKTDRIFVEHGNILQQRYLENLINKFTNIIEENSPAKFISNFNIKSIDAKALQQIKNHWSIDIDTLDFLKIYENIFFPKHQSLLISEVLDILKIFNYDFYNNVERLGVYYYIHMLVEELGKMPPIEDNKFCCCITPLCKKLVLLLQNNEINLRNNNELIRYSKPIDKILDCMQLTRKNFWG